MHPVLSSSWLIVSSSLWTCIHSGCDPCVSEHGAAALHLLYCKWSTYSWLCVCMMQRYTPDVYSKDDLTDACTSQFGVWDVYLEMSTMNDLTMQCWLCVVTQNDRLGWITVTCTPSMSVFTSYLMYDESFPEQWSINDRRSLLFCMHVEAMILRSTHTQIFISIFIAFLVRTWQLSVFALTLTLLNYSLTIAHSLHCWWLEQL